MVRDRPRRATRPQYYWCPLQYLVGPMPGRPNAKIDGSIVEFPRCRGAVPPTAHRLPLTAAASAARRPTRSTPPAIATHSATSASGSTSSAPSERDEISDWWRIVTTLGGGRIDRGPYLAMVALCACATRRTSVRASGSVTAMADSTENPGCRSVGTGDQVMYASRSLSCRHR